MKKSIIFISISLVLIIILGIGVSYSMWNISVSQETTNMAESKCFDLSISNQENSINLDNAYPISNDKGKSLTPYTFKVTNTCDITAEYSVNLEVLNGSTLSSKFVDVMLENNDIKEINLLSNFDNADKVNTSSIESRKLTTGILKSQESKDYSLRLWIDYNTTLEDLNNEVKSFKSKIIIVGKPINYTGDTVFNFDYAGSEQTFIAPVSGTYRLETWGAQGGISVWGGESGFGGNSNGVINLSKNRIIYINVGGNNGYNGGNIENHSNAFGGGATHMALVTGLLKKLEYNKDKILIVSGGGGGAERQKGGSGGGYIGGNASKISEGNEIFGLGGTQNAGGIGFEYSSYPASNNLNGSFGQGGIGLSDKDSGPFGGGGFYGGGATTVAGGGGGGSGYIGNSLLTNKVMYCYNCEESNEESTKTISTTCNEETPTSYCAKKGNGYARITLVSIDE